MQASGAFQLEIRSWLSDPNLTLCGAATRGIWFDALLAMWQLGGTGKLTRTVEELSRLCRATPQLVREAAIELQRNEAANVEFHSDGTVTLINRRMVREHAQRQAGAARVRRHRKKLVVTQRAAVQARSAPAPSYASSQWPLSVKLICDTYPNTDDTLLSTFIDIARSHVPSIHDAQLAEALRRTHTAAQRSSGLWLHTLPPYLQRQAARLTRENLPKCETCQGAGTIPNRELLAALDANTIPWNDAWNAEDLSLPCPACAPAQDKKPPASQTNQQLTLQGAAR